MNLDLLATILTAFLALLAAFGGAHKYVKKFFNAIKETTDVGNALNVVALSIDLALKDNIVEKGEVEEITAKFEAIKIEIDQAKTAWNELFKKVS